MDDVRPKIEQIGPRAHFARLSIRRFSFSSTINAPSCDMPALLSIQRPRQLSCQLTFDPAEASTELPASLLTQRRRQLSCQLTFDPADWQQSCRQGPFFIFEIVARPFSMRRSNRVGLIGPKWPMLFAYREIQSGIRRRQRRSNPARRHAGARGLRRSCRRRRAVFGRLRGRR